MSSIRLDTSKRLEHFLKVALLENVKATPSCSMHDTLLKTSSVAFERVPLSDVLCRLSVFNVDHYRKITQASFASLQKLMQLPETQKLEAELAEIDNYKGRLDHQKKQFPKTELFKSLTAITTPWLNVHFSIVEKRDFAKIGDVVRLLFVQPNKQLLEESYEDLGQPLPIDRPLLIESTRFNFAEFTKITDDDQFEEMQRLYLRSCTDFNGWYEYQSLKVEFCTVIDLFRASDREKEDASTILLGKPLLRYEVVIQEGRSSQEEGIGASSPHGAPRGSALSFSDIEISTLSPQAHPTDAGDEKKPAKTLQ